MRVLLKIVSVAMLGGSMATPFNVLAAEKAIKPAQAIEQTVSKAQEAQNLLNSSGNAEEVIKLLKETAELGQEISANYKTEKARDTAIIHLKAVRTKVKEGKNDEAKEDLKNVIKEFSDIKGLI
jgi:succinate dehydrogenase/fumarate reductase flavoprotein subunit